MIATKRLVDLAAAMAIATAFGVAIANAGPRGDSRGGASEGKGSNKGTEATFSDARKSWEKFLDSRTQEDYDSFVGSYSDCQCHNRLRDFPSYPEGEVVEGE